MHEVEGSSPFETTIIQKIVHKRHGFLYFLCFFDDKFIFGHCFVHILFHASIVKALFFPQAVTTGLEPTQRRVKQFSIVSFCFANFENYMESFDKK